MIQYALKCTEGHSFDSWFQSAAAYEKLRSAGHVTCAVCGCADVEKALMAPRVSHGDTAVPKKPLTETPASPAEQALAALKAHVEKTSDYVGPSFAKEARKIHEGEAPERAIWGEAKPEEARALVEEGIKIAPLPFTPTRKSN
ncbi:hypothetical protein GGQ68_000920 [Sagittula marina]|uniref:DUF1178 family protein n=1 Tax=Sagittula marina TaxID=943940 RepID=A0A7W6GSY6_9RHOB|nr:DUF1178 family protein [Sagittula marina]MBB3984604.1 hypothetical protein [Sagittula marina]